MNARAFTEPGMQTLALSLVILIATIAVFALMFSSIPPAEPAPSWASASGEPVPNEFLYVMFPATGSVPIVDCPSTSPPCNEVGVLGRAMVNSREEIDAGGWVRLVDAGSTGWVALNRLTYSPPPSPDLFAEFVTAYRARDTTRYRTASFESSPTTTGTTIIKLRLRQEDHYQEYRYELTAAGPRAIDMTLVFGPALALADFGRIAMAALAAAGFLAVVACLGVIIAIRKRGRGKRTTASGGSTLSVP